MKNLMILAMILMGTTAYTRDFEYREKSTSKTKIEVSNLERVGRITCHIWGFDKENNNDSFLELKKQSRGHEKR